MFDSPDIRFPARTAKDEEKLRSVRSLREMGESFLQSQSGFQDIDEAISLIMGDPEGPVPEGQSDANFNQIKSQIMEIVSTYANIRPVDGCETENSKFDRHCEVINKCIFYCFTANNFDRKFKRSLQHAATSTGYITPVWKEGRNPEEGDVSLGVKGAKQVWVVGCPESMDLQEAYAVGIESDEPLWLIKEIYGKAADDVKEEYAGLAYAVGRRINNFISKVRAPFWRSHYQKKRGLKDSNPWPTSKVWDIYIDDRSVNRTGHVLKMGKQGTNWYYEVPFVGQDISAGYKVGTGKINQETGEEIYAEATRKATESDCRIYPNRRLVIATDDVILYDGPSFWWHGLVPCVQFCFDKWPWEFLGLSLSRDNKSLQSANNGLHRASVDVMNVRLNPPISYDETACADTDIKNLNLRAAGQKLKANHQYGAEIIKPLVDLRLYDIPAALPVIIAANEERMDRSVALKNTQALFRAAQVPSDDTIDAYMQAIGPVAADRSYEFESAVAQVFYMVSSLILQFYDRKRRMRILGRSGLVPEDYNFDPDNMIPAAAAINEDEKTPRVSPDSNRVQRARWFQSQIKYRIVHGSLHELTQTSAKVGRLQLKRSQAPISWGTVLEPWGIENFIRYPDDVEMGTEFEKAMWENEQIAKALAALAQMNQPQDPMQMLQAAMASAQPNGPGRKPSGQSSPHIETKSNGYEQRQTVSES
jgi:hypothetical protein